MQEWEKEFYKIFKNSQWLVDKTREETAMEIIEWIESEETIVHCGETVCYVTPNDIQQLKAKYKVGE